jgi:hypothetical protein
VLFKPPSFLSRWATLASKSTGEANVGYDEEHPRLYPDCHRCAEHFGGEPRED